MEGWDPHLREAVSSELLLEEEEGVRMVSNWSQHPECETSGAGGSFVISSLLALVGASLGGEAKCPFLEMSELLEHESLSKNHAMVWMGRDLSRSLNPLQSAGT